MVVEVGTDRAAVAVDGVIAAEEDPVVGGQPVVVELVAAVADALAVAPADRLALRRAERLADQHVVVDRGDVAADAAQQRREGAGREQRPARPHGAAGVRHLDARAASRRAAGGAVLVDADAGAQRPRRAGRRRASAGVDERRPLRCPGGRRGRSASRPRRGPRRRRAARRRGRSGAGLGALLEPGRPGGLERDRQLAGRLEGRTRSRGARGRRAGRRSSPRRAARASRSRRRSGPARSRARASARPIEEAAVAPAGAAADGSASSSTTSRPGSSALACRAAQSPVKPPPTMQRSASASPASGASGARAGSESVQNETGCACA